MTMLHYTAPPPQGIKVLVSHLVAQLTSTQMSMSKCLLIVQEVSGWCAQFCRDSWESSKVNVKNHLKNDAFDGFEWNPIGRLTTALYCLLGIVTVLSRSLFSILLMKNRELVDLEMYYFMCGILVLAFPMSSLLTPEILFESKNQIALCIPMLISSIGFFHVVSTAAKASENFWYSNGFMCLFFGLAPLMAMGLCLRGEDEQLILAKMIKPCLLKCTTTTTDCEDDKPETEMC